VEVRLDAPLSGEKERARIDLELDKTPGVPAMACLLSLAYLEILIAVLASS